MLNLDTGEVTRNLIPILGKNRAAIMATATVEELQNPEVWVAMEIGDYVRSTQNRNFKDGIVVANGVEYRLAYSKNLKRYRAFRKVDNRIEGMIPRGWFTRVLYSIYSIIEPDEIEKSQSLAVINDILMECKTKC